MYHTYRPNRVCLSLNDILALKNVQKPRRLSRDENIKPLPPFSPESHAPSGSESQEPHTPPRPRDAGWFRMVLPPMSATALSGRVWASSLHVNLPPPPRTERTRRQDEPDDAERRMQCYMHGDLKRIEKSLWPSLVLPGLRSVTHRRGSATPPL